MEGRADLSHQLALLMNTCEVERSKCLSIEAADSDVLTLSVFVAVMEEAVITALTHRRL